MKRNKHQFMILIIYAFVLFMLWKFSDTQKSDEPFASVSVDETVPIASTVPPDADVNKSPSSSSDFSGLANEYSLDVPYISQYPELPTGCEITALAEVLHFYGFDIDKQVLARKYLPMSNERTEGCYINYFFGSPWSQNGSGCFAPAIVTAATDFLSANGSSLSAYNISYSPVSTLLDEVSQGHPVIAWTCFNYDNDAANYREITLDNGQTFTWPGNEHCVVLSGYNLTDKTVTISDPSSGIVTHSLADFTKFYQQYYYQAVVIK